jgi:hypothetical protein
LAAVGREACGCSAAARFGPAHRPAMRRGAHGLAIAFGAGVGSCWCGPALAVRETRFLVSAREHVAGAGWALWGLCRVSWTDERARRAGVLAVDARLLLAWLSGAAWPVTA